MQKYIQFISKNRKTLFVLLVVLNILALVGIFQIRISSDFNIFTVKDSEYQKTLEEVGKYFPTTEQVSYMLEYDQSDLNIELLNELSKFQRFLETIDNIDAIIGPAPKIIPLGKKVVDISNIKPSDIEQVKEYYNNLGAMAPFVSKNGESYGIYYLFPNKNFKNRQIRKIENYLKENNIKYYATGDLYMQQKIVDYIILILFSLPPTAFVLIFLVFRSRMGSVKSTVLSVLPAGIGALWTLGIIGWFGKDVSILTVLAPIFTIVIGSADGLHFVSHVQEARKEGYNKLDSLSHTLEMVGIPMIITTVTSVAGFISLMFMNTQAINDLAIFASIGISLAGVATWYILPLILTGDIELKAPRDRENSLSDKIKRLWGRRSIIIMILMVAISVLFIPRLQNEFNLLMVYRKYTGIYKSFSKFMEVNDGSVPVFAFVKTKDNILSLKNAEIIMNYQKELEKSGSVAKTMSVYDLYSMLNKRLFNKKKPEYPSNPLQMMLVENAIKLALGNPVKNFVKKDSNVSRVIIFPESLKNKDLKVIQQISDEVGKNKNIDLRVTGVPYLMYDLNRSMIKNQAGSLAIAFGLILILLWISLRKFLPTLISLIPITATVVILFGFLSITGISLNLITSTIFSITLGVGIDYAVHFTSVWRSYKQQGFDSKDAADKAYKYTSRPIIANALGLAIGLSALMLSPLKIHVYVSLLMWASMISAVFLSLSVLPTILRKLK